MDGTGNSVTTYREMGWEEERSFKTEEIYTYLWLIHVDIWQKPTQYYKAITLQLKINKI